MIHDKRGERTKQNAGHKLKHKMRICKENVGGFRYEPRGDWFSFAKVRKRSFSEAHARRLRHPPERFPSTTVSGSENLFNYIWNMDIYLTKSHGFTTRGLYSPPGAAWGMFYYGCSHFISRLLSCWQQTPSYPTERLGGDRTMFNITLIGFFWKKKVTPRMLWGRVKHGVIFIFGWTNPLTFVCIF